MGLVAVGQGPPEELIWQRAGVITKLCGQAPLLPIRGKIEGMLEVVPDASCIPGRRLPSVSGEC